MLNISSRLSPKFTSSSFPSLFPLLLLQIIYLCLNYSFIAFNMPVELWTIASMIGGVLLTILLMHLSERALPFVKRKQKNKLEFRLALVEAIVWLAPVIGFLQKCVLLTDDLKNNRSSLQSTILAWPKFNLKDLETEAGIKAAPWLPTDLFHEGLGLIAQLEISMQLLPAAFISTQNHNEPDSKIVSENLLKLETLLAQFENLDRNLRVQFKNVSETK